MCFVDTCALGLRGTLVLELVFLGRVPEARIVDGGDAEVLRHSGDPSREALLACVVVGDYKRDLSSVSSWLDSMQCSKHTLILESWGIEVCPFLPGTVISNTPYSFLFIGCESRFQSLKSPMR